MKTQKKRFAALGTLLCLFLLAGCTNPPSSATTQSGSESAPRQSLSLPAPETADTPDLQGSYIRLATEEGWDEIEFAECEDCFALITSSETGTRLETYDKNTGALLQTKALEGQYFALQAANYRHYNLRLLLENGGYLYLSSQNLEDNLEVPLPEPVKSQYSQGGWGNCDVDPAHSLYVASNKDTLTIQAEDKTVSFRRSDVPIEISTWDNAPSGFDAATEPIQYTSPRILNDGKTVVAMLYAPNIGQGGTVGLMVYDVASGQAHWLNRVFYFLEGLYQYPGGNSIIGIKPWDENDPGRIPLRLNLDTLEVTEDVAYPALRNWNLAWNFEAYALVSSSTLADGRGETVFSVAISSGEPTPLLWARGGHSQATLRDIGPNHLLVQDGEQYLAVNYR